MTTKVAIISVRVEKKVDSSYLPESMVFIMNFFKEKAVTIDPRKAKKPRVIILIISFAEELFIFFEVFFET